MSPFTINIPRVDGPPPKTPAITADRRLYLAKDEFTVVEETDDSRRFLLAPAGGAILGEAVDRLRLSIVDGRVVQLPESSESADADTSIVSLSVARATRGLIADRRLYLAADEQTLVDEDDREAKWLLCAEGQTISQERVETLGLSVVDGRVVQARAVEGAEAERPDNTEAGAQESGATTDGTPLPPAADATAPNPDPSAATADAAPDVTTRNDTAQAAFRRRRRAKTK
jgi:hypothetical protein